VILYVLRYRCRDTIPPLGLDCLDCLYSRSEIIGKKIKRSFLFIMSIAPCKYKEHDRLARRVELLNLEMIPCSFCKKHNMKYIAAPESSRYSEYIRCSCKCNIEGIPIGDWDSLEREEERLCIKKEITFQAVQAGLACIQYLEKQQQFLKKKGTDILRQGLQTLDELEEVEAKEKEEKEVQERAAVNSAALADLSWLELLSEEQLNQLLLDFPEGTAELQPLY
jgi:hypothetical protein